MRAATNGYFYGTAMFVLAACCVGIGWQNSQLRRDAEEWRKTAVDALAAAQTHEIEADAAKGLTRGWEMMCTQREHVMQDALNQMDERARLCISMLPREQRESFLGGR